MGVLSEFGVLTFVVATVLQCSLAAPVTEFFGPPQTIEGEGNVQEKKIEEMERFHRTYENGTVEFKTALSNGHVQYQKISKKSVDGENIQVYEGYISEPYEDGRYGTRYYVADENGYRSSPVIVEDKPPKLPTNGPYSSVSNPQDHDNEVLGESDPANTKIENENTLELKKKIEEEIKKRMNNQNLGPTIKSDILKHIKEEEHNILENSINEDSSVLLNSDLPLSTEGSLDLNSSSTTEAVIAKPTEEAILENKINKEQSILQDFDLPSSTEGTSDLISDNDLVPTTEPQSVGEISDSKISEDPSILQDSDQASSTEASLNLNTENSFDSTSTTHRVFQSSDLSTSTDTSLAPDSKIDLDEKTEQQETTTQLPVEENSSTEIKLDSSTDQPLEVATDIDNELDVSTEITKIEEGFSGRSLPAPTTLRPLNEGLENVKDELDVPIQEFVSSFETSTDVHNDEFREATTEEVTDITLNGEKQDEKTEVPELREEKIEEISIVLPTEEVSETTTEILLGDDTLTEQPASLDNQEHKIHSDVVEIDEVKIDDETSSVSTYPDERSPKEEDSVKSFLESIEENKTTVQTTSVNEEITTILPLEGILKDIQDEQSFNSEKSSRSLDIATELPTSGNNSTLTVENKHTENSDDQNEDSTTEADIISTTGLINDGDVSETDSQTTTELPLEISDGKSSETSNADNPTEQPGVEMYHPVFRS